MVRKAGGILNKTLAGILIALLAANLYIIMMQVLFKKDLPKVFGFAQIIVISGSMQPTLKVGDLLIIREQKSYRVDDIVTFHWGKSLVTHRVVAVNGSEVVTRGDENNVADEPISLSDIEGKVVLRIPKVGDLILFLKTPFGLLLMALFAVVLIEAPNMAERMKKNGGG